MPTETSGGVFSQPSFRDAGRRLQGLCRDEAPKAVGRQIELVEAILEARRLRKEIAESNELVASAVPHARAG